MLKKEKSKDKLEKEKQKKIDKEIEKSESPEKDTAKSHGEILREQLSDAQETYEKSPQSILLSSLTAGLEIGFSYLMICLLFIREARRRYHLQDDGICLSFGFYFGRFGAKYPLYGTDCVAHSTSFE
jgi:hypothetical protein